MSEVKERSNDNKETPVKTEEKSEQQMIEEASALSQEQLDYIHSFGRGNVKLLDKITFCLGVCLLTSGEYCVLVRPELMPIFYMCMVIPLVTARYIVYRMNNWHYFLLDYCYFTNALLVFTIIKGFVFHQPIDGLFEILFVGIDGPLLTALPMWNNSLVFHDLTKLTSITIHLLPGMVIYCMRWYGIIPVPEHLSFMTGFVYPLAWFVGWQVLYLVITEVFKRETIYEEGYMTSVRWLIEEKPHKLIMWVKGFFPEKFSSLVVFLIVQFSLYFITTLPSFYLYEHRWAQTAWIIFCFLCVVWNGANYYFEIFLNRYTDYLQSFKRSKQNKEH